MKRSSNDTGSKKAKTIPEKEEERKDGKPKREKRRDERIAIHSHDAHFRIVACERSPVGALESNLGKGEPSPDPKSAVNALKEPKPRWGLLKGSPYLG